MYDPRRVQHILHQHSNQQQKPDSTVPSPPVSDPPGKDPGNHQESTLADLANSEISLDLQGLIDDAQFGADAENLFGDLIDQKNNQSRDYVRLSPVNSLGSSANSSPGNGHNGHNGDHNGAVNENNATSPSFTNNYRSPLAYLPGSVHGGSNTSALPSITTLGNAVFVKQEPDDQVLKRQIHHVQQNNGYVSSTTHMGYMNNGVPGRQVPHAGQAAGQTAGQAVNGAPAGAVNQTPAVPTGVPSLKNFAANGGNKYVNGNGSPGAVSNGSKKKPDRNSEEYRRRRERNNVAVRKSREKAKARTRDTEDRVKILARENERLQKKVELLQEELAVLRSLFSNVGVLPDHIHRELSKHIDNFQAQHNAMACMWNLRKKKKKISAAHQFLEMMPQFNAKKVIYCLTVAICLCFW